MPTALLSIVRLLSLGCPAAIALAIISVIVLPFNAVLFRWPTTHVRQKITETLAPLFADEDSSATISEKGFLLSVVATLNHLIPNSVLGPAVLSCSTVSGVVSAKAVKISTQATATPCAAIAKLATIDDSFPTTITSADPSRHAQMLGPSQNNQAPKALAFKRYQDSTHRVIILYG